MILELKNLSIYVNEKKVIDRVSYVFEGGTIYIITGPNGAGKSTLLNVIAGFNLSKYKIQGSVIFEGVNILSLPSFERVRRGVVLVPQTLPVKLNIKLRSLLRALNIDYKRMEGLGSFLDKYLFEEMSGGEAKLIDFNIALQLDPKVLLLDEIDSSLDEKNIRKIAEYIKDLAKRGRIVVVVSHSLRLPNKVKGYNKVKWLKLEDGKLIESF